MPIPGQTVVVASKKGRKIMLDFENLDKAKMTGTGAFDIPEILPEYEINKNLDWLPFNYAKTSTNKNTGIHFFIDDYQFARLWNAPDRYTSTLRKFDCVCSPDFSMYTNMPVAMQIYNHYRKHWLAAYWQALGVIVYPTISWSTQASFDWCFDGEPHKSIVAVSSVGTQKCTESKRGFLEGYEKMMEILAPSKVIFCGQVPEGVCSDNLVIIPPHYEQIAEKRKAKQRRE